MDFRPKGVDPQIINGSRVRAISKIVDGEGEAVALQVVLVNGSSLFCNVWSDWSLIIEHRSDSSIPDYFWPPEEYSSKSLLSDIPADGLEVVSAVASTDEVDTVMRIDINFSGHVISARSFGGEIVIAANLSC
ncbi:hypothetical protein AB0K14_30625 [Actinosynnema sp. NPDC050801]|uniref:hypothetical protein n=1 Tax=unclassified Actinosynnema TaxID=2637065 RepID=UPI003403F277